MDAPEDNMPISCSSALLGTAQDSAELESNEEKDWDKEIARYSWRKQTMAKREREDEEIDEAKKLKMAVVPFDDNENNMEVSDDDNDDDDDVDDDDVDDDNDGGDNDGGINEDGGIN